MYPLTSLARRTSLVTGNYLRLQPNTINCYRRQLAAANQKARFQCHQTPYWDNLRNLREIHRRRLASRSATETSCLLLLLLGSDHIGSDMFVLAHSGHWSTDTVVKYLYSWPQILPKFLSSMCGSRGQPSLSEIWLPPRRTWPKGGFLRPSYLAWNIGGQSISRFPSSFWAHFSQLYSFQKYPSLNPASSNLTILLWQKFWSIHRGGLEGRPHISKTHAE